MYIYTRQSENIEATKLAAALHRFPVAGLVARVTKQKPPLRLG